MPSKSQKQRGMMAVCCRQPDKCRADVSKNVACEFHRHDVAKAKKRKRGLIEHQHSKG